jgi:hypothetical protein
MTDNTKHEQFRHQHSFIPLATSPARHGTVDKFNATVVISNDTHADRPKPTASLDFTEGALSISCRMSPESMRTLRDELSKAIRRHDRWAKGEAKRIVAEEVAEERANAAHSVSRGMYECDFEVEDSY